MEATPEDAASNSTPPSLDVRVCWAADNASACIFEDTVHPTSGCLETSVDWLDDVLVTCFNADSGATASAPVSTGIYASPVNLPEEGGLVDVRWWVLSGGWMGPLPERCLVFRDGVAVDEGPFGHLADMIDADTTYVLRCGSTTESDQGVENGTVGGQERTVDYSVTVSIGPLIEVTQFSTGIDGAYLSWTARGADSCSVLLNGPDFSVEQTNLGGAAEVFVAADLTNGGTLTLSCTGSGAVSTRVFTIPALTPAVINSFSVTPERLEEAGPVQVCWDISGASYCWLEIFRDAAPLDAMFVGSDQMNACVEYTVDGTFDFRLSCYEIVGGRTVTAAAPGILSFFSDPPGRAESGVVNLHWDTYQVTGCVLRDGVNADVDVPPQGVRSIALDATAVYVLACARSDGTTSERTLRVPVAPRIRRLTVLELDGDFIASWDAGDDLTACTFPDHDIGVSANGELLFATDPGDLSITCTGYGLEDTATAAATDAPEPSISVTSQVLDAPAPIELCWDIPEGTGTCALMQHPHEPGHVPPREAWSTFVTDLTSSGCSDDLDLVIEVDAPTDYRMFCTDEFGSLTAVSAVQSVIVGAAARLTANPVHMPGPFVTALRWATENVDACTLTQDGVAVSSSISEDDFRVFLETTTDFLLTCTRGDSTITRPLQVTVGPYVTGFDVLLGSEWDASITVDGVRVRGDQLLYAAPSLGVEGPLTSGGLCDSVDPAWVGHVVLCDRGVITFSDKVANVEDAGGIGAVIANNVPGPLLGSLGPEGASTIPAISLSQQDGAALSQGGLGRTVRLVNMPTQTLLNIYFNVSYAPEDYVCTGTVTDAETGALVASTSSPWFMQVSVAHVFSLGHDVTVTITCTAGGEDELQVSRTVTRP